MLVSAIRRTAIPFIAVSASILLLLVLSSADSTTTDANWIKDSPQFNPGGDVVTCNSLPNSFSGPAPLPGPNPTNPGGTAGCAPTTRYTAANSSPNLTVTLSIPKGHYNYAQDLLVTTSSTAWTHHTGTATIPEGTVIGGLRSTVNLGLATNPCKNEIFPDFIFYNADVNNAAANVVNADPEGTEDRWLSLIGAAGDNDGFPGQADADALIVTKYPDTANRLFDPDGSGDATGGYSPVQPLARYAGATQVPAAGDWQTLQVFVFDAGALKAAFKANPANSTHPFSRLDASLGRTSLTILNDPTAVKVSVNPISDFCTRLFAELMLLGNPGGNARITAPGVEGTHPWEQYVLSYRDADGDGIENNFDTCAFTSNTAAQDPYDNNGPDTPTGDMLDSACDPTPGTNTNFGDHDNDQHVNSQDNCPLIANGPAQDGQADNENAIAHNSAAPDGGPQGDAIGDACDPNVNVYNGDFRFGYVTRAVCVGAAAADANNDGYCDAGGGSAATRDTDGDVASTTKFTNAQEVYMNTDPLGRCSITDKHRAWPPDLDNNKTVNILDIVQLTPPVFNTSTGNPNYSARKDFDANGTINILDIVVMTPPVFNTSCTVLP